MTDTTATAPRFSIGRMTATERARGRFMRDPEEHPPAAPVDPSLIATPDETPPAVPERPADLPDAYWDAETGAIKPEAYSRLAELEAAEAAAGEGVPETADGYVLELADPVVGMDGKPVAFDADDPLAKAILPALHAAGVPQSGVSAILQAYAAQEVAAAKADAEAATAYVATEQAKLGTGHKARTAALHGQVTAAIGADAAEHIRSQMRSADAVIALETLVSKLQGPALSAVPLTPSTPASLEARLYGS